MNQALTIIDLLLDGENISALVYLGPGPSLIYDVGDHRLIMPMSSHIQVIRALMDTYSIDLETGIEQARKEMEK